jgi:hypothetical protein
MFLGNKIHILVEVIAMEGLNVVRNDKWEVTAISMTLYGSDGAPVVTSYEIKSENVRLFFSEGQHEGTMIAESVCGKIITWNPESDWFNEYSTIEEAAKDQKENYIGFWNLPVEFTQEFQQYQ